MHRIYAQISGSTVANIILLDDDQMVSMFSEGYDSVIEVTGLSPYPGPGWAYDGEIFTAPPAPMPDVDPDE